MKNYLRRFALAYLISLFLPPLSWAGVGADNALGPTGEYNGSITTAGSYDPYTGNAKRFVDDLTVTSSLGAYPLKWTRVLNTRNPSPWSHSYQWGLSVVPYQYYHYYDPPYEGPGATVNYPDGRTLNYDIPRQPYTYDPDSAIGEPQDRLVYKGNNNFDLLMRDGGIVRFELPLQIGSSYTLIATQIIDPYGQVTTLTYDASRHLSQVREPGGRYLQINWSNGRTSSVQAYSAPAQLAETVSYSYDANNNLANAYYDDGTHATYTYGSGNVATPGGAGFLIQTCDDFRFAGPMKQIQYEYVTDLQHQPAWGQIKREKNLLGQMVSEVTYPLPPGIPPTEADYQRTETRGDGRTRMFQYSIDVHPELKSYTDFKGQTTQISFPSTETPWLTYRRSVTDARLNTTATDMELKANAVMKIRHPGDNSTIEFTYSDVNNPYYMTGRKDENGNWTYFDRDTANPDPNKRGILLQTRYPDNSFEQFTYNGFGQVETHTLTTGGVENFRYDGRGLKYLSWPPATPSDPNPQDHPTQYFYYTSGPNTDRLHHVIDPRLNTTWYEYNQRGQVTKVTHQDGSYTQSGYNDDGTLAWTADENHPNASWNESERTRYTYDEYKRVLTVTNLLNETTTNYYGLDWVNPLVHTTNCVKCTLSPLGKNVVYDYDENLRKKYQTVAANTLDIATTFFDYDEVGNLTLVRDPRWYVTTYHYDERNRKIWMNDPIPSDRNSSGHTMNWEYDAVGNKRKETRADNAFRSWDYDSMNVLSHAYDWRTNEAPAANQTTTYTRNVIGTEQSTVDTKGAIYYFHYDTLGRKIGETYPPDASDVARTETWRYDPAGNMDQHISVSGNTNTFTYDNRNRVTQSSWASGAPTTVTAYDPASRVTSVLTKDAQTESIITTVAFGYDFANRQIWEDQTLAGYPTRRFETPRDGDGNRISLDVPGWFGVKYDYTQRNQLSHIYDGNGTTWFTYNYDASGNMTYRWDNYGGANDVNGRPAEWIDALNRPMFCESWGGGTSLNSRAWSSYDVLNHVTGTWRDENGSRGEAYSYDVLGQLQSARYNADQVFAGNPTGGTLTSYNLDGLNRIGPNGVDANGTLTAYTNSEMNQYKSVSGQAMSYDGNFNLTAFDAWGQWTYQYDAENHLISGRQPGGSGPVRAQFTYDGLGRCVKRTLDGVTTLIGYDGWKPTVEWDGSGNWLAWNVYGPGPDEILFRCQVGMPPLRYHHDRQGNVAFVFDWDGNRLEKYTYDAFGWPTVVSWTGAAWDDAHPRSWSNYGNRFMFNGREFFAEMGVMDYRHRFYHPALGRFLQADPTGFDAGDMNLFRYCGDDPVDHTDPMGLLVDRTWDQLMYEQGGSQRSFEVDEKIKDLHSNGWVTVGRMLFTERNQTDSSPGKPTRNLGGSKLDTLGGEMAKMAFNTGPPGQEQISWLFEKNGTPGAYAASVPIPGGAEPKQFKEEGNQPRLGVSATPTFIPKGYHYVGFAYSHLVADKVIPLIDRQRAWRNRFDAYLAVPHQGSSFPDVLKPYHYDPNVFPAN
jgi:RHS repeat-associated protein